MTSSTLNGRRQLAALAQAASLALVLAACGGGGGGSTAASGTPAPPSITAQAQSVTADPGQSVSFSVVAEGSGMLSYQWYRNGAAIDGATATSYSVAAGPANQGASFHVVVSDANGQQTSGIAATLTVTTPLTGVAAVGAPLAGASITLTDAAGRSRSTTADDEGAFRFDVSGLQAPFQLVASLERGENDTVHFALVPQVQGAAANTANITPLTTAVAALASDQPVPRPLSADELAALDPTQVQAATRDVVAAIAPVATAVSVDAQAFDPLTTAFTADRTGVDALLDQLAVTVRPDTVTIANKMAVSAADAPSTLDTASGQVGTVVLDKNALGASTAAITDTAVLSTNPLERVRAAFERCFAEADHTQRQVGGVLHAACSELALPGYLTHGSDFATRWSGLLGLAELNGARVESPIVRLRLTATRLAVNFNFVSRDGSVRYTMPDILVKNDHSGEWWLEGNQRRWHSFVETAMVIDQDATSLPYNNVNFSKIESSLRVMFDPRFTLDGSTMIKPGAGDTYDSVKAANATAGRRTVGCVVVFGPGERVDVTSNGVTTQKIAGMNPDGVLMRVPAGSAVGDYMAYDTSNSLRLNATHITGSAPNRQLTLTSGSDSICNSKTTSASSNYGVELSPLAGGRPRSMYLSARYAEVDPTPALSRILDNNPLFTLVVFDTQGAEIDSFRTRFLGGLAPVSYGQALLDEGRLPTFTAETVRNYLDTIGTGNLTGNLPDIAWTAPAGALRPDRTNAYSEVYLGNTTVSPGSFAYRRLGSVDGSPMVSTGGVSYRRGTTTIGSGVFSSTLYGTDMFAADNGNPSGIDNAYLLRQLGLRFYTEDNLRLYRQLSNRVMRY